MRRFLSWFRPKTLSGRMMLILVLGLLAAQAASLVLHLNERAGLMAAGHVPPGMPAFEALPLRFIWHVSLTLTTVIVVSLVAIRWATKPLQQMTDAATAFAHDLDAAPLDESGPIEVRRAAQAFNFMQQRLRRLVVERGRALAAVSHDLRTPLMRMRLRAELIDDSAVRDKLNADIDAMQAMVGGLLAYLRGLEDAEPAQRINMVALLASVIEDERAMGRATLSESAPGSPAPYEGKLSILKRAIANLLDNAVAHGQHVTVRIEDAPEALRVVIEDDGPGIPAALLERVTEPFVRTDAARRLDTGGVGLGLAIARDAAACHGGQLILENRARGGLRASLVLPRTRPAQG
ncbi:ATP-binding protein [Aromatoleum bremense]|uniref:histidine kinase n=1 Tax=Aromatoleum bremense TaxID=76115 RepID=A0ABX1NYY0_9RHOO|nr:ATP-binding protein [Aromatoleum bremense]NMG16867.1 HAMP domain-containing protein [Aromatoleum bremense]QTQ33272.1 Two component system sensor histidine kinase [Aromatoleum bremense]